MGLQQDFYQAAQNQEFARKFQFRVVTLGPYNESDLLYLTTATLPGKSISNQEVPYMGLKFNVPGTVDYTGSSSWKVTFRCDEGINIRNKAESWIKEIFDDATSTGKYGVPVEQATMYLLGKDLNPVRQYNFIGVYPQALGEMQYDIKDNGVPQEFDVTLAYQYWRLV